MDESEKIKELEKENKKLNILLEKFDSTNDKHIPYILYHEARKYMITTVSIFLFLFAIVGSVLTNNIIDSVKSSIIKESVEVAQYDIKQESKNTLDEFKQQLHSSIADEREKIIKEIVDKMIPILKESSIKKVEEKINKAFNFENNTKQTNIKTFQHSLIILASSPNKIDMVRKLERISKIKGKKSLYDNFPQIDIKKDKDTNRFILIIGSAPDYLTARKIERKAYNFGFKDKIMIKKIID